MAENRNAQPANDVPAAFQITDVGSQGGPDNFDFRSSARDASAEISVEFAGVETVME
jgi:hypothetical protein